jgi:putative addiction module component (TIGR02574 family)
MTKEQILSEAMKLGAKDREELAEDLWQQVMPGELSPEQIAELHRRIEAMDSGQDQPIPGPQVLRELRERFER